MKLVARGRPHPPIFPMLSTSHQLIEVIAITVVVEMQCRFFYRHMNLIQIFELSRHSRGRFKFSERNPESHMLGRPGTASRRRTATTLFFYLLRVNTTRPANVPTCPRVACKRTHVARPHCYIRITTVCCGDTHRATRIWMVGVGRNHERNVTATRHRPAIFIE